MRIDAYLFFDGRCEEAIGFYREALQAEPVMMLRFRDSPVPPEPGRLPPGNDDKVMHATLRIGESVLMCSDGTCGGRPVFGGFSLSLDCEDEAAARRTFAALAEGGQVQMPLGPTFWAPLFGMVSDRFGVTWMVGVSADDTD